MIPPKAAAFGDYLDDLLTRCCALLPRPFRREYLERIVARFLRQAVEQMRALVHSSQPTSTAVESRSRCRINSLFDTDIVPACHRLLLIGLAVDILHMYAPTGYSTESPSTSRNGGCTHTGGSETESSEEHTIPPSSPVPVTTDQGSISRKQKRKLHAESTPSKKRQKKTHHQDQSPSPGLDAGVDFVSVSNEAVCVPSTSRNPLVIVNPPPLIFNKPMERRVLFVNPEPIYFELGKENPITIERPPLTFVRETTTPDLQVSPTSPTPENRGPTSSLPFTPARLHLDQTADEKPAESPTTSTTKAANGIDEDKIKECSVVIKKGDPGEKSRMCAVNNPGEKSRMCAANNPGEKSRLCSVGDPGEKSRMCIVNKPGDDDDDDDDDDEMIPNSGPLLGPDDMDLFSEDEVEFIRTVKKLDDDV